MKNFIALRAATICLMGLVPALTAIAAHSGSFINSAIAAESKQEDYDRLDGTGMSGKKVNVIEWEGNLEIHVYPGGSLKGLSLKLDKKNKDKPVMVIGYRFDSDPSQQLIRRAILGINMAEGFKAFRDPSAGSEYDKIVISNNGQAGLASFTLDAEPTQLYPDGHPALAKKEPVEEVRAPASKGKDTPAADEDGTIQPFFMKHELNNKR